MDDLLANKLRKHPLLVRRCEERAKNAEDLQRILDSIPDQLPFRWDHPSRSWKTVEHPVIWDDGQIILISQ